MSEFIRFLLISNVSLMVVWAGYWLFLRKTTFHSLNRGYLLLGSVVSLLMPFVPVGSTTTQQIIGLQLPAIEVGRSLLPTVTEAGEVNWLLVAYALGAMIALGLFVRAVSSMIRLLNESDSEIIEGQLVLRSDKAGPFSFLSIIHLPKKLPLSGLRTILKHEIAHVELGHSYDVLWLSFLRILFWFNPALALYQRSLREIHEYQADALTHISSSKEHYVKVQLDQLFQLPSELSFANSFHNSNDLKKRIEMIYSEKTSKWGGMRYFMVLPLVAIIGLLAACTETPTEAIQEEVEKVYKEADVMPEFPGGMPELMQYMVESIKYPKELQEANIAFVGTSHDPDVRSISNRIEPGLGAHEFSSRQVTVNDHAGDRACKRRARNVHVNFIAALCHLFGLLAR